MESLFTGPNLIILSLMIWSAFMMRTAATRSRRSRNRNIVQEAQTELRNKQRTAESQVHQLEVRLLEFDRDITARIDTTMTLLDQLIAEADREIVRLEMLLAERQVGDEESLSADEARMVVHLAEAGYSRKQIANFIGRSVEAVFKVLKDDPPDQLAA